MSRRIASSVLVLLGFVMTVLVVAGWGAFGAMTRMMALPETVAADSGGLPEAIQISPAAEARPLALVLASNAGTEITDMLAPFAVLAASGAFEVRTVAPQRRPSPLLGGVDFLTDFALDDPMLRTRRVALVVVPLFLDPTDARLIEGVRSLAAAGAHVLSICEGARTVAEAGLFDSRPATTHFFALAGLAKKHPAAQWRQGVRFVSDERVSSSAGVTASIDATLDVVRRLAGRAAAERAVAALGLVEQGEIWSSPSFDASEISVLLLGAGFGGTVRQIGVVLPGGVDELQLAALLDLHPRSFAADTRTLSVEPGWLRSRYGLWLRARTPIAAAAGLGLDELLVPAGNDGGAALRAAKQLARSAHIPLEDLSAVPPGRSFDYVLDGIAQRNDRATARVVAEMVEWPWQPGLLPAPQAGRDFDWPALLRLLAWGFSGALLVLWGIRRSARRLARPTTSG